jgi:hypothetical protein
MERIKGLNDEEECGVLFELKLYYRAEEAAGADGDGDTDVDAAGSASDVDVDVDQHADGHEDGGEDGEDGGDLLAIKNEKLGQLDGWHRGASERVAGTADRGRQEEEDRQANEELDRCKAGIGAAEDAAAVDGHMATYFKWHQAQRFRLVRGVGGDFTES